MVVCMNYVIESSFAEIVVVVGLFVHQTSVRNCLLKFTRDISLPYLSLEYTVLGGLGCCAKSLAYLFYMEIDHYFFWGTLGS